MSNLNKARFMKGEEITTKKSNEDILDKIRKEEFGDEDYELAQEEIIPAEEHEDEKRPLYKTRAEENHDYDDESYDNGDDEDEDEDEEAQEEEVEEKPAPKRKPYNRKPQQKPEPKAESHSSNSSNDNPLYKKLLLKLKLELIEEARNSIEIDGFSESEIDMVWESILEDIQK